MTTSHHTPATSVTQQRQLSLHHVAVGEDIQARSASYAARIKHHCAEKIAYHDRMVQFHEEQYMYYSDKLHADKLHDYSAKTAMLIPDADRVPECPYEISDAQWKQIAPLLTLGNGLGRPYADTRRTMNGILYVIKTDCGWRNMPKHYGSYVTCWRRLTRWQAKGVWKQIKQLLMVSEAAATGT